MKTRAALTGLAFLALFALAVAGSACAASQRESALRAAVVSVDASKEAYVAYDQHEQDAIVKAATSLEDGKAKLATYRAGRVKVVKALTVAYEAIATAALLNTDQSLSAMATAVGDLLATVKTLTGGAP